MRAQELNIFEEKQKKHERARQFVGVRAMFRVRIKVRVREDTRKPVRWFVSD